MTAEEKYRECLDTMYALRRFGIKLGLDIIDGILTRLDNPQNRYRAIHVAGTNGKGSIASALSSILEANGYRVGLYTSPHLVRFNERINVDNVPVSDAEVIAAYEVVKNAVQGDREPTFFEYTTAMALRIFADRNVDWAVIETGMGGRLDATNLVRPDVCIISNLSLEHQEYLGDSLEKIAFEKAGIIKPETPAVTGVRQPEAMAVLERTAAEKKAPLYRLGSDFTTTEMPDGSFTYRGIRETWEGMRTGLSGKYQIQNAAITLAACEILRDRSTDLRLENIRAGLLGNRWPGRLEVVSQTPMVIMDGAHNLAAVECLTDFLRENFADRSITLVVGILEDKPYVNMLHALLPVCRNAILTQPDIHRALPADTLHEAAKMFHSDLTVIPSVARAVAHAVEQAEPSDLVCIAGSLYVVGEAKAYLETKGHPAFKRKERG